MSLLKVAIKQCGSSLIGYVIHQDESLRNLYVDTTEVLGTITQEEKFQIKSREEPELIGTTLFIRGVAASEDEQAFYYKYLNVADATNALNVFRRIVKQINETEVESPEPREEFQILE